MNNKKLSSYSLTYEKVEYSIIILEKLKILECSLLTQNTIRFGCQES